METKKSALRLLAQAERNEDLLSSLRRAVLGIASGEKNITDRLLSLLIDRMLKSWSMEIKGLAAELITHAANSPMRQIPLERIIGWVDAIRHTWVEEVQHSLSALIRHGKYPDAKTVHRWIDTALSQCHDKRAALMLLSDGRYQHWRVLSTRMLCRWLESSISYYQGNHGAFRFFGILALRMRYIRSTARVHEEATQSLAEALYVVGKYDHFFFEHLMRWVNRLRPDTRASVREHYIKYLRNDIKATLKFRQEFPAAPEPAML